MLSHIDAIKIDIQGLTPETEKIKEIQGHYQVLKSHRIKRNLDQDHTPENGHPRKGQSHVPRKDEANEVCQSHDHILIHIVVDPGLGHLGGPGLGQLDVENLVLDRVGNHLHLGIFEDFPLVGKKV